MTNLTKKSVMCAKWILPLAIFSVSPALAQNTSKEASGIQVRGARYKEQFATGKASKRVITVSRGNARLRTSRKTQAVAVTPSRYSPLPRAGRRATQSTSTAASLDKGKHIRYGRGLQYGARILRWQRFPYAFGFRYGDGLRYGSGFRRPSIRFRTGMRYGSGLPRYGTPFRYDPGIRYGSGFHYGK